MVSSASYVVLPAHPHDTSLVYDAYFAAFAGSALVRILFPSAFTPSTTNPLPSLPSSEFREAHTAHTLAWISSPESRNQFTFKAIERASGEVVGMALWDIYWQTRSEDEWRWKGVEWLEGLERERAEELLGEMVRFKENLLEDCHVIAVRPEHRRKGVGKALMRWGIDIAEQLELPIYLESSREGVNMYRGLGFKELQQKIVHRAELVGEETDVEVPLMVRMPSTLNKKGVGLEEWMKQ